MGRELTPMMEQYLDIKKKHADAILFFRLGDFYEMFFDDAEEASRILHITLTARSSKNNKIPMCGVPHHAAQNYIARLVKAGKKVAICEQVEKPTKGKNIVKREISKVITPGTFIADSLLDSSVNQYLLSLTKSEQVYGLAYADISTGEFFVTEVRNIEELFAELYKISPSETIVPESLSKTEDLKEIKQISLGAITDCPDWYFEFSYSIRQLKEHFNVETLEGFGCEDLPSAISASGALIKYLKDTQRGKMNNIDVISTYSVDEYMGLDKNSHRHLELVKNQQDLTTRGTLLGVLDKTRTPMGRRLLRKWILNPLIDPGSIKKRQISVQDFFDEPSLRSKIRDILKEVYDMERLTNKIVLSSANARDLRSLASSIANIGRIKSLLENSFALEGISRLSEGIDPLKDVLDLIEKSIKKEPPATIKEGDIISDGFDSRVDELRMKISGGKDWMASLQKKEIERTGINSLKIGYNKIYGYYIEVTKAKLDSVPDDYIRKQTLVGSERFITDELKRRESEILGADEHIKDLEYEIFQKVRSDIAKEMDRLKKTGSSIAELDVFSNLAEVAVKNRYVRPKITDSNELLLKRSRHPVLEKVLKDKEFVPNDLKMGPENRIFIITGSNMAGKSTFIRQVALICLMAQMGSFVPAESAEIGVIDRIFTRVGASDRIYQGMSTFMVEMIETANILNNATGKSLIILDEIGRGTSTFDGVSIAWSVVEYLDEKVQGSKTMFATHYHELTELSEVRKGIKNYHLSVQRWKDDIVFLYKVAEGICDESFGVQVAKLAGLPPVVVKRAKQILANLHKDSLKGNIRSRFYDKKKDEPEIQPDFFEKQRALPEAIKTLKDLDPENMTPLDALRKLVELKKEVEEYE